MALTLAFGDGDTTIFPCPNSLICAICGGRSPYTVTSTKGTIQTLTATSFRISAPVGPVVAGTAYRKEAWGSSSPTTCTCNEGLLLLIEYDCNDVETSAGQSVSCSGPILICKECTTNPPPFCNGDGATMTCANCGGQGLVKGTLDLLPCARLNGAVCDVRTAQMIADGCAPCAAVMVGAVVTVTDSEGTSVSRTFT